MATSSTGKSGLFSGTFTPSPAIAIEKLLGSSNYVSWSKAVEKWCMGQGLKDHLTTKLEDVKTDKENWEKADALLCTLLWQSIDSSLHNIYTNFDTCYDLWTQAKSLYTNDIQRLYSVVDKLINLRQQGMTVPDFVGQISSIKAEFNTLLPAGKTAAEDLAQRDKFFMVCTLALMSPDLASVRDQILASPTIPTLQEVFTRLLRVTSVPSLGSSIGDSSALISTPAHRTFREDQGGDRGGSRAPRPKCAYCHRWGHTKDKCYKLHGRPPRANLAHTDEPQPEQSNCPPQQQSVTLSGSDYDEYLRYRASQQSSSSVASIVHSGNPTACLTQSSSLGPWVLDSGASDHISGNSLLLSNLTHSTSLPLVTLANGSKQVATAIGSAKPLPSVPLDSVLYIPSCPFNLVSVSRLTRALNCSITFTHNSVLLQDRSTGQVIGA